MKIKKIVILILMIAIILILNSTNVFALVEDTSPKFTVAEFISEKIMLMLRFDILVIVIGYLIIPIIYLAKSKETELEKIKGLKRYLIIVAVSHIILIMLYGWAIKLTFF